MVMLLAAIVTSLIVVGIEESERNEEILTELKERIEMLENKNV